MQRYLAALMIVLAIAIVLTRVVLMKRRGITAMKFGAIDKKDFLIPPFAFLYFYLICAAAFGLPSVAGGGLFHSDSAGWLGIVSCCAGLSILLWSLISFGWSFRIGIDTDQPDRLITTGVFAHSRNPIYVAFALVLVGEFLVFPYWPFLAYLIAGIWLFHRQVLLEERFLIGHYGQQYQKYCKRVRRYF